MKIYIASALTFATDEHKILIQKLRDELQKNYEILDYFGLGPGEPRDIYLHDIKCIKKCDLLLAECSEKSLGTGYEIGYALTLGKKVLACSNKVAKVGRMIRGITNSNFTFLEYENIDEIIHAVGKI